VIRGDKERDTLRILPRYPGGGGRHRGRGVTPFRFDNEHRGNVRKLLLNRDPVLGPGDHKHLPALRGQGRDPVDGILKQ